MARWLILRAVASAWLLLVVKHKGNAAPAQESSARRRFIFWSGRKVPASGTAFSQTGWVTNFLHEFTSFLLFLLCYVSQTNASKTLIIGTKVEENQWILFLISIICTAPCLFQDGAALGIRPDGERGV